MRADTTSSIPPGMVPITDDPQNVGGYRDPNTGYEYNREGTYAWLWDGSGNKKYNKLPSQIQAEMQAAKAEARAPMPPPSGGAPVGGAAGSPGSTGAVGDMQSRSGASPTSYGQVSGPQTPPPPMPGGAAQGTPALPFVISSAPSVDVGVVPGGARPYMPQPGAISPEEWATITRTPNRQQQPPQFDRQQGPARQPRLARPLPVPQYAPAGEELPWYQQLLNAIF